MKQVYLTELSQEALKSQVDYDHESGFLFWKNGNIAGCCDVTGYIKIRINSKLYYAHRLVWLYLYGEWPPYHIDHINGCKGDNRKENLRLSTHAQNQQNKQARIDNYLGVKGVSIKRDKFQARLKGKSLGTFNTIEEAAQAYEKAAREAYGEFALR